MVKLVKLMNLKVTQTLFFLLSTMSKPCTVNNIYKSPLKTVNLLKKIIDVNIKKNPSMIKENKDAISRARALLKKKSNNNNTKKQQLPKKETLQLNKSQSIPLLFRTTRYIHH